MGSVTRAAAATHRLRALGAVVVALAGAALVPAAASARPVLWEPTAPLFWTVNHSALMAALQNGQCIEWTADKRPDIIRRGMEAIVARELAQHRPEYLGDWSARYWARYAARAGIPTGRVPKRGAVAVFQPGVLGAAPAGHVAYVQKVTSSGWAYISQMHAPVLGKVSYRWLSRAQARTRGITYIYR